MFEKLIHALKNHWQFSQLELGNDNLTIKQFAIKQTVTKRYQTNSISGN